MSLREKQSRFAEMVFLLLAYIRFKGYEATFGDAARMDRRGHKTNSFHYDRLAIDLNLFKDGIYLTETEDHLMFGQFWEFIGGSWGGRFDQPDGNHYSYGE